MTIEVRPQRTGDDTAVDALLTAAFEDADRVAALARALRARRDLGASLVAVDGTGTVVGQVQLSTSWVDAPERLVDVLVLSPLAVAPGHRRRGLGTRLLAAATEKAGRLGAPLVFLEGDPDFYAARGWRAASELGFSAPSTRIPGPAFQVVALPGYDPATMRGAVVYNDTFWSRDCVGLRGTDD